MPESMRAAAKINLYLKVAARRPDGYHELRTIFLPLAAPADDLAWAITGVAGIELAAAGADTGDPADNLIVRAARLYAERAGLPPAWRFRLDKRIPVAAGMGGGSADAAAALLLLNRHFGRFDAAGLRELALKLGADVPFFLEPRPALASGVGDRIDAVLPVRKTFALLIAAPGFPVSAKWAYTHLDPCRIGVGDDGKAEQLTAALAAGDAAGIAANLHNDLAFALYDKFPLLGILRRALLDAGAPGAEITGSGPTLFAVFRDDADRDGAMAALRVRFGGAVRIEPAEML
jgi:4-diphosphocytidyl-2-C-methyl-D-erythritol kinase